MTDKKYVIVRHLGKILSCLMSNNRLLQANVTTERGGAVGTIYIGKVKNIMRNLNAAFVEIADRELCYLPLEECRLPYMTNRAYDGRILQQDEIVVQLVREPVKTKEAVVTTKLSFTGKYAVIMPEAMSKGRHIGYSNKLTETVKRGIAAYLSAHLPDFPYNIIIRTNAGGLTDYAVLIQEIEALSKRCETVLQTAQTRTCYSVLEQAPPTYLMQLRDMYTDRYDRIVTDDRDIYEQTKEYLAACQPEDMAKLVFYEDTSFPLAKLYALDSKLKAALEKRVWLKSGGYLMIESTEALTVIDVNSGKNVGKKDKEHTVFRLNQEAAEEIAIQLRLRNLSGIIIIDFINMQQKEHQQQLLDCLSSLLKEDTVRTDVIDITPLGLVEVTRKKRNKTLAEQLGGHIVQGTTYGG